MKQQAFHTSHYPITGISRESLLIFCLKTVTVQHLHSYRQKRSVFRFQSYLRYCLPGISHSHEVPSLCGVQYLLLFVTTFFSVPLPVFETVSADITIVGFFSFFKVFVDTRIKSSEQSGIKGAKCFLPQHLLPNIVNASQFQTVRKLLFYLVLPVCRIFHCS